MNALTNPKRASKWSGAFFSAKYFLVRALALAVLFLAAHLAGLREYTTFISGTSGGPDVSMQTSALYGATYLALYMGCVVLAPILLLAAGLLVALEKFQEHRANTSIRKS